MTLLLEDFFVFYAAYQHLFSHAVQINIVAVDLTNFLNLLSLPQSLGQNQNLILFPHQRNVVAPVSQLRASDACSLVNPVTKYPFLVVLGFSFTFLLHFLF
ncbi:hypothetical protein LIER_38361 [Lithospermum erythrorhizon]|uniref:Uncharacterized protein n=1 Tax=Lithospermum erythrorhizon TaxID=34254 RepID=A0AAV3Q0Q4_LITER